MGKKITVHYEGKPLYDITLATDFNGLPAILQELDLSGRKLCIVTDSHVEALYAKQVQELVEHTASTVCRFCFPAGEASKTLEVIEDLYEVLIQAHFDRKDVLLALGGGVVGDMTGYAAANYLRGIRVIQIPTSLLAMVDSSIGGKTGVDFRGYKNMIGAFHQPSAVYMNLSALQSLTDEQYYSGFGEIVKHGLIKDMAYFHLVEANREALRKRDLSALEEVIYGSCQIKRHVVEHDPKEQGERALLNFGHTLGHAIEKLKNFELLHGECVSIGMVAAATLSRMRGLIREEEYAVIVSTLQDLQLPVKTDGIDAKEIIQVTKSDKKMDAKQIRFILLQAMGEAVITTDVTDAEMEEALQAVLC